jgi:hypothetical protein
MSREGVPASADAASPQEKVASVGSDRLAYLPGAAHVAGSAGTYWSTDLDVHNPGDTALSFTLSVIERSEKITTLPQLDYRLAPGTSLFLSDVLFEEFGLSGAAVLHLEGPVDALLASSRTYNQTQEGTYGQFIAACPQWEAIGHGQEGRLVGLHQSRFPAQGFRTNLGLMNASGSHWSSEAEVLIDLFRGDGTALGQITLALDQNEYVQIDRIFERVTMGDVNGGFAVVSTTNEGDRFFAYASVVDNRTGDPIFIPAVRIDQSSSARSASDFSGITSQGVIYVPGCAHVSGYGGSTWRTDLVLHNPAALAVVNTVELLEADQGNISPLLESFTVPAGASLELGDVLQTVFGITGTGALRVTAGSGTTVVISRTYNQTEDGTYGQFVAGAPEAEAIGQGEEGRIIQLSHHRGEDEGYRTNIGFVNASSATTSVRIRLHEGDGNLLGTREFPLMPFEFRQVNKIFESVTSSDVSRGYAVVSTDSPDGAFFAYASVVDNRTGDPVLVPAEGVPQTGTPQISWVSGRLRWLNYHLGDLVGVEFEVRFRNNGERGAAELTALVVGYEDQAVTRIFMVENGVEYLLSVTVDGAECDGPCQAWYLQVSSPQASDPWEDSNSTYLSPSGSISDLSAELHE